MAERHSQKGKTGTVRPYDFRFPDKFPKDQLRHLQRIHDSMGRSLTTALSAQLRVAVRIYEPTVEQFTYGEYLERVPDPTILTVFTASPLPGNALLEIDPALGFVMIDRLLGGRGEVQQDAMRALTDIETTLIQRVVTTVLTAWRDAWHSAVELHVAIKDLETNPLFVQISSSSETVLVVTVPCGLGHAEGAVRFCLLYETLEPLLGRLAAPGWASPKVAQDHRFEESIARRLERVPVSAAVEVGTLHLTLERVLALQIGDVFSLGVAHGAPVPLRVRGQTKYVGTLGRRGRQLALEIRREAKRG